MPRSIIRTALAAAVSRRAAGRRRRRRADRHARAPGTTTMTVGPRVELPAGAPDPTDFPGVSGTRRGQPIPSRYRPSISV